MPIRYTLAFAAALLTAAFSSHASAAGSSELTAALKTMPAQADKFRSMMGNLTISQFHFVNVAGAVDSATLRKNSSEIADLRDTLNHATLEDNQGIVTSLRKVMLAKELTIDQVVAIYVSGTQVTLYYQ